MTKMTQIKKLVEGILSEPKQTRLNEGLFGGASIDDLRNIYEEGMKFITTHKQPNGEVVKDIVNKKYPNSKAKFEDIEKQKTLLLKVKQLLEYLHSFNFYTGPVDSRKFTNLGTAFISIFDEKTVHALEKLKSKLQKAYRSYLQSNFKRFVEAQKNGRQPLIKFIVTDLSKPDSRADKELAQSLVTRLKQFWEERDKPHLYINHLPSVISMYNDILRLYDNKSEYGDLVSQVQKLYDELTVE